MTPTKTYVEPGWKRPPSKDAILDEETYRKVLPIWVKACVDVILYLRAADASWRMVIAKRKIQPMMDWWIFGGRIFATDESLQHALVRKLKEEIGLADINPDRIPNEPLRIQMYKCAPDNSVILAPAFCLEITPAEYQQMQANLADSPEYSDLNALAPWAIAGNNGFHEALRDYASSLARHLGI